MMYIGYRELEQMYKDIQVKDDLEGMGDDNDWQENEDLGDEGMV